MAGHSARPWRPRRRGRWRTRSSGERPSAPSSTRQRQVELGGVAGRPVEGQRLGRPRPGSSTAPERGVLQGEHDLEQRRVRQAALRRQLLDQPLEGQVLVGVGGQGVASRARAEQLAEAGVPAQVGRAGPGCSRRTRSGPRSRGGRARRPGCRRPKSVLPGEAPSRASKPASRIMNRRGALAPGERAQGRGPRSAPAARSRGTAPRGSRDRRPRPVGRQLQRGRRARPGARARRRARASSALAAAARSAARPRSRRTAPAAPARTAGRLGGR